MTVAVLAAAVCLVGCAPTDQGADGDSAAPAASGTQAAEPSATATPYSMDDY